MILLTSGADLMISGVRCEEHAGGWQLAVELRIVDVNIHLMEETGPSMSWCTTVGLCSSTLDQSGHPHTDVAPYNHHSFSCGDTLVLQLITLFSVILHFLILFSIQMSLLKKGITQSFLAFHRDHC